MLAWRFKDASMAVGNLFEHLWVLLGPEYPHFHFCWSGNLTLCPDLHFGNSFNSVAWSEGCAWGEHKAADVTDRPLSSTVLFTW